MLHSIGVRLCSSRPQNTPRSLVVSRNKTVVFCCQLYPSTIRPALWQSSFTSLYHGTIGKDLRRFRICVPSNFQSFSCVAACARSLKGTLCKARHCPAACFEKDANNYRSSPLCDCRLQPSPSWTRGWLRNCVFPHYSTPTAVSAFLYYITGQKD